MKMYMFKCFDSTALDCDVFLYFEFGATELNSMFKPIPCHCRATCGSNSFEFDTAVARNLKQALYAIFLKISCSNGIPTVIRFATTFNALLCSLELAFYMQVCLYITFKKPHDH